MLIEMHCHTAEYSPCSEVSAVDLVRQVHARGLAGAVFTDHHYLWSVQELSAVRRAARLPDSFLLLSGQEVSTIDLGDVLVYGGTEAYPWGLTLAELRNRTAGAALVWAHPFRWGRDPVIGNLFHPALNGVEILNGNQTDNENTRACAAWRRFGFTALAGSDVHELEAVGRYPTRFRSEIRTLAGLIAAIATGACGPRQEDLVLADG
jgi:predicted metal-dependent phosphoesterase TrpH